VVKENYRRFACDNCSFSITKIPGGRQFEISEVEALLRDRSLGPLQGFRSKMGRPFAAILKIVPDVDTDNYKLEFDFGQQRDDENSEPVDFTGQEVLGACPKCSGGVYEMGLSYVCENSVAVPRTCDFRSGKIILQQEIATDQMKKLLREGRTDLLAGFKSSRTGRFFKAYLVKGPEGKIAFEFEPRKTPVKAAGKTAASKGAASKAAVAKSAASKKGAGAAPSEDSASAVSAAPAKKSAARKTAAKKAASRKTAASKSAAKKAAVKKTAVKDVADKT
jgi:DNA topoisomerase-3